MQYLEHLTNGAMQEPSIEALRALSDKELDEQWNEILAVAKDLYDDGKPMQARMVEQYHDAIIAVLRDSNAQYHAAKEAMASCGHEGKIFLMDYLDAECPKFAITAEDGGFQRMPLAAPIETIRALDAPEVMLMMDCIHLIRDHWETVADDQINENEEAAELANAKAEFAHMTELYTAYIAFGGADGGAAC